MKTKLTLIAMASLSFVATGCAGIRVVKTTPAGGELALVGSREGAQEKANAYMAGRCPGGYDVLEEGEAVVGQETTTTSRPTRGLFGGKQVQSNSSSEDKREWRVKYQCKGAEGPAAASPAPAASPAAQTSLANPVREVRVTF